MLPGMKYADGMKKKRADGVRRLRPPARRGRGRALRHGKPDVRRAAAFYPRGSRAVSCASLQKPNGFTACDGLYWVDGTGFYKDGVQKGTVSDSRKTFAVLGAYLLIFPDKAYYHRETGVFGSLEATWTGNVTFADGTLYGGVRGGLLHCDDGNRLPLRGGGRGDGHRVRDAS